MGVDNPEEFGGKRESDDLDREKIRELQVKLDE